MRLERTRVTLKKGINDRPWNFLYVTPKDAHALIRSLSAQLETGNTNDGRSKIVLENGEWFTAFVENQYETKPYVDAYGRVLDEIQSRLIDARTYMQPTESHAGIFELETLSQFVMKLISECSPMLLESRRGPASVETFVNKACGELPPHPPGWDEWWQRHKTEVAKAIEEAQASTRRTLLHRAFICLEDHGLLPTSKVELVPTSVVREILDLLDEGKDEKTHLRLMGGPPAPHNECGGPGDLHAEEPVKVTCKACRDTVGFARAIANEQSMKAMKAEAAGDTPEALEHCGICGEQYCDRYDGLGSPIHKECQS